jgi:hypothetical protein
MATISFEDVRNETVDLVRDLPLLLLLFPEGFLLLSLLDR